MLKKNEQEKIINIMIKHNPKSSLLIGEVQDDDIIKIRKK